MKEPYPRSLSSTVITILIPTPRKEEIYFNNIHTHSNNGNVILSIEERMDEFEIEKYIKYKCRYSVFTLSVLQCRRM